MRIFLSIIIALFFGYIFSVFVINQLYFYQIIILLPIIGPFVFISFTKSPPKFLLASLILAIPFNPSINLLTTNSYVIATNLKFWLSDVIVFMMLIYILIDRTVRIYPKNRNLLFGSLKFFLPFICWFILGFISIFFASNHYLAIIEFINMTRILLIVFSVFYIFQQLKENGVNFMMSMLTLAFLIQVFLVLGEFFLGHPLLRLPGGSRESDVVGEIMRPGGTMGHSSNFAKFATFSLPIAFAFFCYGGSVFRKVFFSVSLIGGLLALILTVSRSGLIACLVGLLWFCMIFFLDKKMVGINKKAFAGLLILAMVVAFVIGGNRLKSRIHEDQGSVISRPQMFEVAWNVILAHPLFGVGLNNYTLISPKFGTSRDHITKRFPYPVHNIYLLYAAEMGLPAAVLFISFLILLVRKCFYLARRNQKILHRAIYYALGIGIVCTWVQGLVGWGFRSSIVHTSYLAVITGLVAAVSYKDFEVGNVNNE